MTCVFVFLCHLGRFASCETCETTVSSESPFLLAVHGQVYSFKVWDDSF